MEARKGSVSGFTIAITTNRSSVLRESSSPTANDMRAEMSGPMSLSFS
jgi:hypothetical protein